MPPSADLFLIFSLVWRNSTRSRQHHLLRRGRPSPHSRCPWGGMIASCGSADYQTTAGTGLVLCLLGINRGGCAFVSRCRRVCVTLESEAVGASGSSRSWRSVEQARVVRVGARRGCSLGSGSRTRDHKFLCLVSEFQTGTTDASALVQSNGGQVKGYFSLL